MMNRVLIVDEMHEALMNGLKEGGMSVDYCPSLSRKEVLHAIPNYEVLVVRSKVQVDKELLSLANQLKLIARAGSGMDNIDLLATRDAGITTVNAPEGNADAVGEMALAQILNLTRNVNRSHGQVVAGQWLREANRGVESEQLTIAIIGFGHTGSALAKKLSGLNSRVIFFDKFRKGIPTPYANEALWEEVTQQADVVSFHVPLEDGNYHLIDKQLISSFKKPIYLLNLSRGKVMKTEDVLWGLDQGLIRGAALDVLENEAFQTMNERERTELQGLVNHPDVVLTPHIAGWTFSSYLKISEVLLHKIMNVLS